MMLVKMKRFATVLINIGKKMKVEIGIAPYTTNKRNEVLMCANGLYMVTWLPNKRH